MHDSQAHRAVTAGLCLSWDAFDVVLRGNTKHRTIKPWNHRMVFVARDIKDDLVPPCPTTGRDTFL